jgi:hypothetical protein
MISWQQYDVGVTLVLMTLFFLIMDFTSAGRKAYGVKLWWLTAWAIFVYALISGGFFK